LLCYNRSKINVSDWSRDRIRLLRARSESTGNGSLRYLQMVSRVFFPEAEDRLFMSFHIRRDRIGLKTGDIWLRLEMRDILAKLKPPGWEEFCSSPGWLSGFKRRYRISSQVRTNKKHCPIEERLPEIAAFHRDLLTLRLSAPQTCPRYGRFSPGAYFHMDQIPLPFVLASERSLNEIGQPNFILMPKGSGLDKRQCSIQLCIRAEGRQLVRPMVIFRGTGCIFFEF
jgi:hypothetical protein